MKTFYEDWWNRKRSEDDVWYENILDMISHNKRILDVGCGSGKLSVLMRDKGNEVIGIDISKRAIEITKSKGIDAYVCDIENEPPLFAVLLIVKAKKINEVDEK